MNVKEKIKSKLNNRLLKLKLSQSHYLDHKTSAYNTDNEKLKKEIEKLKNTKQSIHNIIPVSHNRSNHSLNVPKNQPAQHHSSFSHPPVPTNWVKNPNLQPGQTQNQPPAEVSHRGTNSTQLRISPPFDLNVERRSVLLPRQFVQVQKAQATFKLATQIAPQNMNNSVQHSYSRSEHTASTAQTPNHAPQLPPSPQNQGPKLTWTLVSENGIKIWKKVEASSAKKWNQVWIPSQTNPTDSSQNIQWNQTWVRSNSNSITPTQENQINTHPSETQSGSTTANSQTLTQKPITQQNQAALNASHPQIINHNIALPSSSQGTQPSKLTDLIQTISSVTQEASPVTGTAPPFTSTPASTNGSDTGNSPVSGFSGNRAVSTPASTL